MARVYSALRAFVLEHRGCGELRGDADPLTPEGYRLWTRCACGALLERWVTPSDADEVARKREAPHGASLDLSARERVVDLEPSAIQ